MKKKIVALLLVIVLLFTYAPEAFAAPEDELISGIDWSWDMVANSADSLNVGGTVEATSAISITFKDCMSVISGASSVLSLVNGSVNFLKLIGVIEDPTATALANIQDMLGTMKTKIDAMDKKLDNITTKMTEIKASIDFNNRAYKADNMRKAWSDFYKNYMQQKLDRYITEFDAISADGIRNWFMNTASNPRKSEDYGIDNSIIVIKYKWNENKKKFVQSFINENRIPDSCGENEKYLIIPESCLPSKPEFNVNTYRDDLIKAISDNIESELGKGNTSIFETCNYTMPNDRAGIEALAADAVNALSYRVTSVEMRKDPLFVSDAVYDFEAYCQTLLTANDGIDAKFKSFYLTHAFESEIEDDIKEFADQMIFKTGVYALFVSNLMGMSNTVHDSAKKEVMETFVNTTKELTSAKKNCLTGNDQFCYITNTELDYCNITYQNDIMAKVEVDGLYRNFKNLWINPIGYTIGEGYIDGDFIGEENMLVLAYTLQANGLDETYHDYLYRKIGFYLPKDSGIIVTEAGKESVLDKDSAVKMKVNYVCGDYLKGRDSVYLNNLPKKMSSKKITCSRKYTAPTFNMATGAIENETLLHAVAGYGDTYWGWFEDEVYLLGGPYDAKYIENHLSDDGKYYRTFTLNLQNSYNTIIKVPIKSGSFGAGASGYSPLESYFEFMRGEKKNGGQAVVIGDEEPVSLSGAGEKNPDTGAFVDFAA